MDTDLELDEMVQIHSLWLNWRTNMTLPDTKYNRKLLAKYFDSRGYTNLETIKNIGDIFREEGKDLINNEEKKFKKK